jgi:CRISPR-associated protein Csb2
VFVPPNDDAATALSIMPDRRRRQERRFAACVPLDSTVRFIWPTAPVPEIAEALAALARDTSYLGHSASLVRCAVVHDAPEAPIEPARRVLYPGRLAELERAHSARCRPSPGASVASTAPAPATTPSSVFGSEWLVFAHAGGQRPDAVAGALACKVLLKAVQAGYSPDQAPGWISGHAPDGTPHTLPHLAAVPLLDAGWEWSEGRLMGLALVIPREQETALAAAIDPDQPAPDAMALANEANLFRALAVINQSTAAAELEIALGLPGGRQWRLRREAHPEAHSLRPRRYAGPARAWASVTPIALDRHPKQAGEAEAIVMNSCVRIGLPKPSKVLLDKHSAIRGSPSTQPGARAPAWTGWRLPPALAGRRLTHAVIVFDEPVGGSVILGAGRFAGLGLCMPLDATHWG